MSPSFLRAFDQHHDGTLLGEGAAFLVLEAGNRAIERTAPIYAFLRGIGSANDAATMAGPDLTGRGARLAMQRAIFDAGLAPEDVDLVNAHASGTPLNDTVERDALKSVFDTSAGPLVFATKGNFGHSLGATGAIEAIALILALRKQMVPPILGLEEPDPAFPFRLPLHKAVNCDAHIGLSLTLGFGGFNTCLLFEVDR
jgi:3-oxoacyl-[acyl-carrier-protein] synthase II